MPTIDSQKSYRQENLSLACNCIKKKKMEKLIKNNQKKEVIMILVFIFLILLIATSILFLILITKTIKIKIENLKLEKTIKEKRKI